MLTSAQLACPPVVRVPQPMVAVATGQTASLACLVNENASNQRLYWLDYNGELIVNNSGSNSFIAQDGSRRDGQKYTINTGPVFITTSNHEREREINSLQRRNGNIDNDVLASVHSSVIITSALSHKDQVYRNGIDKPSHKEKMFRDYTFSDENGFRADENLDTRDPFLVKSLIKTYFESTNFILYILG